MNRRICYLLLLALGWGKVVSFGAWSDKTSGLPPVETVSAKTMGVDGTNLSLAQDKLGRIFVGSNRLLVFDGEGWRSFPKPNSEPLSSLVMGEDGKLWAGGTNELGYFTEKPLNTFIFHSLIPHLPREARDVGVVQGSAPIGKVTYFVCRDQLLRWDGSQFELTQFQTALHLCLLKTGNEWWLFHPETGFYRLTEKAPELQIPAIEIPHASVVGLFRDNTGLVLVSDSGFTRPNTPNLAFSQPRLTDYLREHAVSAVNELPDGNLVIGTGSGGIVLASRQGELIRVWDNKNGLPGRCISGLTVDSTGAVLGVTPSDFFHFAVTGDSTLFDARNGLQGRTVNCLTYWKSELFAATDNGIFRQKLAPEGEAAFQAMPGLTKTYGYMSPFHDGLWVTHSSGIDRFDGTSVRPVANANANPSIILPSKANPKRCYVAENDGIASLDEQPDGSFIRSGFHKTPDACLSLHEDLRGRLWIGTDTKGAFIYDPTAGVLLPINHPITGEQLLGSVKVVGNNQMTLLFSTDGVLRVDPDGHGWRLLENVPAFEPLEVSYAPNRKDIFVTFQRIGGVDALPQGAGLLSFDENGQPKWCELDISSLGAIGQIRALIFSDEATRPILWLGGTEGILQVNYDAIATLRPPSAPIIRSNDDGSPVTSSSAGKKPAYPFKNHRINLMVSTGDYARGKNWFVQVRLGDKSNEWSAPANRRLFEFTHLSEGDYRFEARAINSAGMVSEPSTFGFTVLAPWYRTKSAYLGYVAVCAIMAGGFSQIREFRIRHRNRELKTLVEIRTDELLRSNAAKDEFLAGISHEIRNPMNGIIGIAESVRTESLDADSRHKLGLLRQCAGHLASLLEDILDFSPLQAGAVTLESKLFDLPELMDSVFALTVAESEKCGIPVEIAVSPGVPQKLIGDPHRIRQILLNFVGNALKYSGRGQVSVTVWCNKSSPGFAEVFFAVFDEGPGIAPEEQEKLFTRFERGSKARLERIPGTGLGLALCKTLAEKMGGKVWLTSEAGKGSCFYFSANFAIGVVAESTPVSVANAPDSVNGKYALVIDDQEYNRIALAGLLTGLGISALSASNDREALALAQTRDFDFIFLDYSVPGLNGPAIAGAIRALPGRSAQAAMFATTAFNTPEKRAECLAAGMNIFLGKPITMERLRQALGTLSSKAQEGSTRVSIGQADPLASLRLLATKKGITLAQELTLYFSEFETELKQLGTALQKEDAGGASYYAHMLYGRCSFINERDLELTLRQIETAGITGRWDAAHLIAKGVQTQLADLRLRLFSDRTASPRA